MATVNASKTKLGTVRTILLIVILIVIVQVTTVVHFSSYESFYDRNEWGYSHNHEKDFVYDRTEIPSAKNLKRNHYADNYRTEPSMDQISETNSIRCEVTHKDAISALRRVKTEKCRNQLYATICSQKEDKLYWNNITRSCPISRDKGRPSHPIEAKIGYGPPIRILFAMVVHGRGSRQVKRLFKALFHTDHYFYFHVDSRSDYLHNEMVKLASKFDNVAVTDWRMATIWGGASLLQMLLRMMNDALTMKNWKWDFFLNLSAACYPVQTNENLSSFLRDHRHENFVRPHGGKTERFVVFML